MIPRQKIHVHQIVWLCAGLVLVICLAFEPVRYNDFIDFDDTSYITENPHIQSGLTHQSLAWAFTSGYASNWHPLTWLSHMLDIELFGFNPLGHHLVNLVLHVIATLLLFVILYKLTGAVWCSFFTALVFGIHPLRVESVAWAAERKDVLCALFWMLTLLAYVDYVRRGGILRYLTVILFFALGLLAKPMIVTLPIVLLLLDWWPLDRIHKGAKPAGLLLEKVPLMILAVASSVITYTVQQSGGSMGNAQLDLLPRIANAVTSYVAYLGKIFWPQKLAMLYPFSSDLPLWKPAASAIIFVVLTGFFIYMRHKQSFLAAGWGWYIISMIPVIGLVQVGSQSMADRYTYLPSIGISIVICWGLAKGSAFWRYRKTILITLGGITAIGMSLATRHQLTYWKDTVALFERTLAVTRDNYVIHHNLGWVLWKQQKAEKAFEHIKRALEIWPDFPDANINMAVMLTSQNQPQEAVVYLQRALKMKPDNAMACYNMGIALEIMEQPDDAFAAYEKASEIFQHQLQKDPRNAEICRNLGFIYQQQGQIDRAVSYYRAALEIKPDDTQTCWNIAVLFQSSGQYAQAADYYRKLLRIKPDMAMAANSLAWILATTPDNQIQNPNEAIGLAQKACQLTLFQDVAAIDTLAAAYASAGQFADAVGTAQKALALAKTVGPPEAAQAIEKRLQLYQAQKPYFALQP